MMYEDEYFRAYQTAEISMPAEADALRRYQARLVTSGGRSRPPRVLDIGVGHGGFLGLARREGWDALGVDVSDHAATEAKERYGVEVIHGTLESARFPGGHFDLVHLSHVLEHLPDPPGTLREIRRILAPSGRVVIEVPNELENLQVRIFDMLRLPRRRYPVPSTHLYFFSPGTLAAVIISAGLRPARVTTFRDVSDRRRWRRLVKRTVGMLERPFGNAPLIEAVARLPP
jgi:SAM-dependent methyltransferase